MAETLSLGGREWTRATAGPAAHDMFVMIHARHAGLGRVGMIREGEEPTAYAQRILDALISSGRAFLLLGGLLLPAGKTMAEWAATSDPENAASNGMARASASFFAVLEGPEKQQLYAELVKVVLDFFESGIGSWVASQFSSAVAEETPTETTIPDRSASGPSASDSSLATTTT